MKAIEKHKKSCGPLTSVYIVQVEQRKKKRSSGREADCVTLEGEGPKGSAGSNPACSS